MLHSLLLQAMCGTRIQRSSETETQTSFHLPFVSYRENFPKQYRDWQTGSWQQDIAYRDSLRHAHSLARLKHRSSLEE